MQLLTWPELHGSITHFPIAMLLTAILFDLGGFALKRDDLRKVGFWMLVVAVLGAVGALTTGWITGNVWFPPSAKPPIFYQHRLSAFVTSGVALLLLVWRIAKKDRLTGPALYASLAIGIWLAIGAGYIGYLGGKMALPESGVQSSADNPITPIIHAKATTGNGALESGHPAQSPVMLAAGQKAYMSANLGCVSCHSMNGSGGRMGPDLTHEGSRQPDVNWQVAHLKNPQKLSKNSSMPPYANTDSATLSALAAFLVSKK